jgi:Tol biopolymer transport system component
VTRPTQARVPRDPYGIGPVRGYVGPIAAAIALLVIGAITLSLINLQLPFQGLKTSGQGEPPGPAATPAPSNVVIVEPAATFPGSIVYAKAGNIWIQRAKTNAVQLTTGGQDSMPSFSPDGAWVYFVRRVDGKAIFPTGGGGRRTWYDLATPYLMRMKTDDPASQERLLVGQYKSSRSTWFYWIREPVLAPNGRTVALISDGPNPTQNDVVLQFYDLKTKKLTKLKVPETPPLGHQDPVWRADGKVLLFVKNGRELTRAAPQILRYDVASAKTTPFTGPGYLSPSYSPDSQYIAATKTDSFGTNVVILDGAGKELLRVTDDDHSFSPVWSPAANSIAFLHLAGTIVDLRLAQLDASSGRWTVTKTIDLTKISGLDGASRPSWFVPASELPAPSGAPSQPASGPVGSGATGSIAP